MKPIARISLVLVGVLLWTGCRSPDASRTPGGLTSRLPLAQSKAAANDAPTAEQRAEALARFAAGISHEANGELDLAIEEFYKSAIADPANESLVIELSRRFLQMRQPERAVELLSLSAKRADTSAALFAALGRAHLHNSETNHSVRASQIALKKDPLLLAAHHTLFEIHIQTGQAKEALKLLENAARQPQADAVFLLGIAELYANYARIYPREADPVKPRALDLLKQAAALNPQNPHLQQKIGESLAAFGETQQAREIFESLLGNYAHIPVLRDSLREKLAGIYLAGNDRAAASAHLQALIRDNPTRYPHAYSLLGSLSFEEKDFTKAADYFSRALLLNPDAEQPYYDLAGAQLNLNQATGALETITKARARFPQSFVSEFLSALAQGKLKNYAEAIKHYTAAEVIARATEPARLDASFYFYAGSTCERKGDYEQAEKYFLKCLELEPGNAEALNYLGYMWAERGVNLERARELIEKAVKQEPNNAAFVDSLGWVLFKLGQFKPALAYLRKAAELSEEPDPVLFDHIGDVYNALKRPAKAREFWKKAFELEPSDEIRKKLENSSR